MRGRELERVAIGGEGQIILAALLQYACQMGMPFCIFGMVGHGLSRVSFDFFVQRDAVS